MKQLILAEKPSVARDIARVMGAARKADGFIEGGQYVVTWALGHLVTLADPDAYDEKYKAWRLEDLPMLPTKMKLVVIGQTKKQFYTVQKLMARADIGSLVIATDAGRELIAKGIMTGTIAQDAQAMADCIAKMVENANDGRDLLQDMDSYPRDAEFGRERMIVLPYSIYSPQEESAQDD